MKSRPDMKGVKPEVLEYIEGLEALANVLNGNGAVQFMLALNCKLMELSKDMIGLDIDLTGKDDKTLDRFIKMATVARSWTADFKAFNLEYGEQVKQDATASQPLIEKLINRRSEKGS
jgi:hypothetical protein